MPTQASGGTGGDGGGGGDGDSVEEWMPLRVGMYERMGWANHRLKAEGVAAAAAAVVVVSRLDQSI